jgi:hypothetical protein
MYQKPRDASITSSHPVAGWFQSFWRYDDREILLFLLLPNGTVFGAKNIVESIELNDFFQFLCFKKAYINLT